MLKIDKKLGEFYLGYLLDPKTGEETKHPLLYDSKNLTTHAVCLGMTGSGKTGLCIDLLEEAGLNHIPAIIIDPKGDVSNLLLNFPGLSTEEFRPWIDEQEAERKGISAEAYAKEIAEKWKKGLENSGEDVERVRQLKDSVEMTVYTPGNDTVMPISILSSFSAPTAEELTDTPAIQNKIQALASSLLTLIGIEADPIKSREQILLSTIIDQAWQKNENLDLAALIQRIIKPPFNKIGALDIDTFFPQKERLDLSVRLNGLLASPSFKSWLEGAPLDIDQFLHTKSGKPKFSIFSIAHLADSERMFFVTLLLNEIISWMRQQPGTSNLKAILYMDEIFGYFPPIAMPPSKLPMLTLLKQARAYGLGIVLATQNPVDLDYKGLSNCGTWFIGKLQTAKDREKVTEGLTTASNGTFDRENFDHLLSNIVQRTFLMRSIYEKEPVLFKSRWTLSYLKGPLTLAQIQHLMKPSRYIAPPEQIKTHSKPIVPYEISEFFDTTTAKANFNAEIMGIGKLHYVQAKQGIDIWEDVCWIAPADEAGQTILWSEGKDYASIQSKLSKNYPENSQFTDLPAGLTQSKNYSKFKKSFEAFLYQNHELTLLHAPEVNLISDPHETEEDFNKRLAKILMDGREEKVQKLRQNYQDKISLVARKLKAAEEKLEQRQHKSNWLKAETFISFFSSLFGAFLGRGVTKGTITQAGNSIKRASRIGMGTQAAAQAEEDVNTYQAQLSDLHFEMQKEIDALYNGKDIENSKIEKIVIPPRKSDISIDNISIVWI